MRRPVERRCDRVLRRRDHRPRRLQRRHRRHPKRCISERPYRLPQRPLGIAASAAAAGVMVVATEPVSLHRPMR